jgi:hypothetical protein
MCLQIQGLLTASSYLLGATADSATASNLQSCVVPVPGPSACGLPQNLAAGGSGVRISVLLKTSDGSTCASCETTGVIAGTLNNVAQNSIECSTISTNKYCTLVWAAMTIAGNVQLTVSINGAPLTDSPYTVHLNPGDNIYSFSEDSNCTFPCKNACS